jgi:hypothetical protein
MTEHLDRIYSLGFKPILNWGESFYIDYPIDDILEGDFRVLFSSYQESYSNPHTYEEMLEVCCDIFYGWYNKNLQIIKDFESITDDESFSKIQDCLMGDITKIVARDLNLNDILGDDLE